MRKDIGRKKERKKEQDYLFLLFAVCTLWFQLTVVFLYFQVFLRFEVNNFAINFESRKYFAVLDPQIFYVSMQRALFLGERCSATCMRSLEGSHMLDDVGYFILHFRIKANFMFRLSLFLSNPFRVPGFPLTTSLRLGHP